MPDLAELATDLDGLPIEEVVRAVVPVLWSRLKSRRELIALRLREGPRTLEYARLFIERVVLPGNRLVADWLDRNLPPARVAKLDTFVAGRTLVGMLLVFFLTQELLGGNAIHAIPDGDVTETVSEVFLHGVLGCQGAPS